MIGSFPNGRISLGIASLASTPDKYSSRAYRNPVCATEPSCYNNDTMSTTRYLDRFLDPIADAFTPEFAEKIVQLRADDELEGHIHELRRKAEDGVLTPEEDADYKDFVEAVDMISILQAKARQFLAKNPG